MNISQKNLMKKEDVVEGSLWFTNVPPIAVSFVPDVIDPTIWKLKNKFQIGDTKWMKMVIGMKKGIHNEITLLLFWRQK